MQINFILFIVIMTENILLEDQEKPTTLRI